MDAESGRAGGGYPRVSTEHLKLMLENVFKLPRSDELDSGAFETSRYTFRYGYSGTVDALADSGGETVEVLGP